METVGATVALELAKLRDLRRRRLWTQQDLAKRAGVSSATLRAIEGSYSGRQPSLRTMRSLAEALGVEPDTVDEFRAALGLGDEQGGGDA